MKMRNQLPHYSFFIDFLLLAPVLIFTAWVYLIPPFQTFGYHPLFSDDAIFATLARKVLEQGPSGAFHLAWGPLQPWIVALLNMSFNIPLEEGGRIITGSALFLRIIPIYFLTRYLFNKFTAVIAIYLVSIYTFLLIPAEATLAEGLYSLIIFTGFLISFKALQTKKVRWYILSGSIWGVAYLARLEGWFFLTPLLLLTGLNIPKKRLLTLKLFGSCLFAFIIISSPFLSFINQAYKSWTLNPRASIILVAPGNLFTFYRDDQVIATAAQIYFSGEPKYYNSSLWHPAPFLFWRAIGQTWSTLLIIPLTYLKYFQENSPLLLFGGFSGLSLTLFLVFKNKLRLLIILASLIGLSFSLLDFSLTTLEFTSPIIFNPNGNLDLFINQFWRMLSTKGYLQPLIRDAIIAIFTVSLIFILKKYLLQLTHYCYLNKLKLYLPLSLFLGFLPLFFNSFANKYAIVTGAILSIYTSFIVITIYSFVIKKISKQFSRFPKFILTAATILLVFAMLFRLTTEQYNHTLNTRGLQYQVQDFQISYLKKPGEIILNDHGPGAKVGTFHEAPAFYAQGTPFYFAADSNITLEQTLKYFEINEVDYFVANKFQAFYTWKQLRPLMAPSTKIPHWKIIYSDPAPGKDLKITELDTDVLVTVWKHVD